jgi:hypothetical protein
MTVLLDRAVMTLRALPQDAQDEIARILLQWTGEDQAPIALSAEDEASFAAALAQAERGEFASDADVKDVWIKHGL